MAATKKENESQVAKKLKIDLTGCRAINLGDGNLEVMYGDTDSVMVVIQGKVTGGAGKPYVIRKPLFKGTLPVVPEETPSRQLAKKRQTSSGSDTKLPAASK